MLQKAKPISGVNHLIAVASGKGGVGKSTVSVNLALAFLLLGRRAGILDADLWAELASDVGGVQKPTVSDESDEKKIHPLALHGLQAMSIGWLVDEKAPLIWRGPMVTSALQQIAYDTLWDTLDELVVDLPPGTGDIHLTLAQKMPVTGAVIVTTPQALALADARRAIEMFQRVRIPILGVVENMAAHHCPQCGFDEPIFGEEGGESLAREYGVPLLGALPLTSSIRADVDNGCPTVVRDPAGSIAQCYRSIAEQVLIQLESTCDEDFPEIVVRND